ncbi:hypothetical protein, partial [Micromonospora sp. KC606]|uniref:hypothetical protein n=1 Tax=Micromonospora sp. KC606 TaxID=2530379 RepID=UPI001A9D4C5F
SPRGGAGGGLVGDERGEPVQSEGEQSPSRHRRGIRPPWRVVRLPPTGCSPAVRLPVVERREPSAYRGRSTNREVTG